MTDPASGHVHILMMGWHYPDEAVLERETFASEDVSFDIRRWALGPDDKLTAEQCDAYDAVIQHHGAELFKEPEAWYSRCRIVVRAGVGTDNIDFAAWGKLKVPVVNVPDYGTNEVADHAIALMMTLSRGTAQLDSALRRDPTGGWKYYVPPLIRRLSSAVFGVLGMGPIGMAAARRASGLGMKVVFLDPFLPAGVEVALGYERVAELGELMAIADVLSVHVPNTPKTRHMLNANAFALSKPGQIVINTARGTIIDLDALAEAIRSGRVGGAGLDVLSTEPPDTSHPLIAAWQNEDEWIKGRVILTPHGGFYSPSSMRELRLKSVRHALDYIRRGRLTTCVNRRELEA